MVRPESPIIQRSFDAYERDARPIVDIDESGFAHDMPRTDGYAPRGQGCPGQHDWNAKGRVNVIGALLTGVLLCVGGCCAWG